MVRGSPNGRVQILSPENRAVDLRAERTASIKMPLRRRQVEEETSCPEPQVVPVESSEDESA